MGNQKFRITIIAGTVLVIILDALLPFSTDVYAETGESEAIYRSKGTITDEADINIDSTDIYTLDNAIKANNKTLENYAVTAGDIYNNLSAIDSAVSKAKTNLAQSLEDMNIYVSRTDAGAVNSHAGTTDWVGTTTAAKSAAVANYTLEELIGQMKTSVTGAGSEMTAKINVGDFKSKKATSSVASGSQTVNLSGKTEINLDKDQQVVFPSGYYGNGITVNNVCSVGTIVNEVAHAFYYNNMISQGGKSGLHVGLSFGNGDGIWANDSRSSQISDVIPLILKDGNGMPYAILNNIIVSVGTSTTAAYSVYKPIQVNGTINYSFTTNRGNTVISRSFSNPSTDTYNLFGISGLAGADSLTLNASAYASVNMNGCSYKDRYGHAEATMNYTLQYVSIKL